MAINQPRTLNSFGDMFLQAESAQRFAEQSIVALVQSNTVVVDATGDIDDLV